MEQRFHTQNAYRDFPTGLSCSGILMLTAKSNKWHRDKGCGVYGLRGNNCGKCPTV